MTAVRARHESLYWHTDTNPVDLLRLGGVEVDDNGTCTMTDQQLATLLEEVVREDDEDDETDRVGHDPRRRTLADRFRVVFP